MNNKILNSLLYLHNELVFAFNVKTKKCFSIRKGSNVLSEELDIEPFCDLFAQVFDVIDSFKPKLIRFLTNFEIPNEPIDLTINYTKNDGTPLAITYKGAKIDDENVLFSLRADDHENSTNFDELTKCHTKSFIVDQVKNAIIEQRRFVLLLVDIDNFRDFNENYGHMFGDMILIEVAATLKKEIGNRGYVARIGGDEFLVLLFIDDTYDAMYTACRDIRASIALLNGSNIKNASLSATIGCAAYPNDGDNYEIVFKKADAALLRGKRKGRNCFVIYLEANCGTVTLDDKELSSGKIIDRNVTSVTNYNVISAIIEILNKNNTFMNNIKDSLSLIGNYFILDRISLIIIDPETEDILDTISWYTQMLEPVPINPKKENIEKWRKVYDKTKMLKINQLSSNKNIILYDELYNEKTAAILAFELSYEGKIFGQIRFDMVQINRFWQSNDVGALMLISKTFAIKLSAEYMKQKHFNDLYIDKLTGIYNYSKWLIDVDEFVKDKEFYSLIIVNIVDYYSLINLIGASAGNRIIKRIALWLKNNADGDLFCRVTGETFAICTEHVDKNIINNKYNNLYEFVKKELTKGTNAIRLRAGIYIAKNGESIEDAIDKTILVSKTELRSENVVFFTEELDEQMKEEKMLEMHLEKSLENNEFMLFIQPKISTKSGKIESCEALTRWNFKFQKILAPFKFIPLFEKSGLITKLDYKVFENVCIFLKDVIDSGEKPVPISVNVSRYTVDYDEYITTLNSIRNKYNIPVELIELEITEGMYTENVDSINNFVNMLRKEGYTISIDDFGSGYSNLNNISKLKFEILKLDRSICTIEGIEGEIILKSIIDTAKLTGHTIVCEGVETKETLDKLTRLGADLIQGYYFDKPLEQNEFRKKYIK